MNLNLISSEQLIDNVWAFRFEPSEPLKWEAGQYIKVRLVHDNPDDEGTERYFTISSAPFEGVVQITTRVTNTTFKQALSQLAVGDSIELMGMPEGDFVWTESDLPIVMVAGGIGVTPYHSILKQRAHDGLSLKATVYYGSRTVDVPFRDELEEWSSKDTGLSVQYIVGEPLTVAKLKELDPQLNESVVYVSGPEPMVEALGEDLKAQGLPEEQLKQDYFPNYTESNY